MSGGGVLIAAKENYSREYVPELDADCEFTYYMGKG